MKNLVGIFLCFLAFKSYSQDCFIDQSFAPAQFKNHKVKTVKVSMVPKDSATGLHQFTYELATNNFFYRSLRHSVQGYLESTCSWSKDSLKYVMTVNSVDVVNNTVIPVSRLTRQFNKKHQLIMHKHEELMGNYLCHITRFNPLDTTETYIETIAFNGSDTAQQSINRQNSKGFLMITREKKNGSSTVKKQEVRYKNGMVEEFDEYENGKLISSRKGNPDEYAILRKGVDPESRNALPFSVFENNDTLAVNADELPAEFQKVLGKNFKEKKLIKIIKYFRPDKMDIYGIDYLYSNGLPLISYIQSLNTFMFYEYEFYTVKEKHKP